MFKRIFGIGKKKDGSAISSVLEKESSLGRKMGDSVLPLHFDNETVKKKKDPAEVLNEAVNRLVEKLESINGNLDQQVGQNQRLVQRMDVLPEMLSSLPRAVEENRQAFARVADQLEQKASRDEKMSEELVGIHEKVSAATQTHDRMAENFSTFSDTLAKLDQNTVNQSDWLRQFSHAFAESERYFKYALEKQQRRFYWILGISVGICFFSIASLVVAIALLV